VTPQRTRWYRVRDLSRPGGTLYDGADQGKARAALATARAHDPARYAQAGIETHWVYPPPEACDACVCKHLPNRQFVCPYGHAHSCHWPLGCVAAGCDCAGTLDRPELEPLTADERFATWLAEAVLLTDTPFPTSPDAGEPGCLCSRCGKLIREEPLRLYDGVSGGEWRFHPSCMGIPTPEDQRAQDEA
jgi:hypothetical protein